MKAFPSDGLVIQWPGMTTSRTRTEPPADHRDQTAVMRRPLILLSLGLALLLVAGVLIGSKLYLKQLNNQPVALTELPSPDADSPECAALVDSLPDELAGHSRAELLDPAPAGAAVWQSSSAERVTLRCGVDAPLQFTELTPTDEIAGARWMKVVDPTPGSNLTTWFTVDRSPVVAVTADDAALHGRTSPVEDLDVSALPAADPAPGKAPLAELETSISDASSATCRDLVAALPQELADGYARIDVSAVDGLGDQAAAWSADGLEPVVLKCGVAPPPSYAPGAQLTQINGIPWFEETAAGGPTQATTLYALGRATDIAVSLPAGAGEGALTALTNAIEQNVPAQ